MTRKASQKPVTRFLRNERGQLSIEAVLALPILVWAITATFVFWDAFKTLNISQKATYTVADMLSREDTNVITPQYLTAMHEIYDYLSNSEGDNALRVTVVEMQDDGAGNGVLQLIRSEPMGAIKPYETIDEIADRIPEMAIGDQMIVVESEQEWTPFFRIVGLTSYRFREVALARPRFAPQITFWDNT